jgi:hypothetical protein
VCSEYGEPIGPLGMQPRPGRGALSADPTVSQMTDLEIVFGILGAYLAVPVTAVVFTVVSSIGSDSAAPGAAP